MDQKYPRNPWYDQSLPARTSGREKKQRKPRTGVKITAIVLCVVVLIAASVLAFGNPADVQWYFRGADGKVHTNQTPAPDTEAGEQPETEAEAGDGFSEDYRDFFEDYYYSSSTQIMPDSRLEKADLNTDFRLEIHGTEGKRELTLGELYTACVDTVVNIQAVSYNEMMMIHSGTGIIVSDTGFILTNQHIISDTDTATVIMNDGSSYLAFLVGEDKQTDLAVLKIAARNLPYAELGDSTGVQVGDAVAAIGNPLGDELINTLTNGIISALDRQISVNGRDLSLMQTTAAINEGNSGGPLFNMYGQVIGITNMKMSNAYSDVTIEGIGFAIPTDTVKTVTDQLIANGSYSRPGLGITVGAIPDLISRHYDLPGGLYINAISEGSSAAEQGVQVGDILTHVNGVPVSVTDDVLNIRDTCAVGDEMTLTIFRDGETFDVVIVLRELNQLY